MGGFNVTIDDKGVQSALARLEAATGDLKPVMDDLGLMLQSRVQSQFDMESAPGGGRWTPLKSGRQGKMLQVSQKLIESITYKATSKDVVLGTNWPYAAIHQFGGMAGVNRKVRIPARPYMLDASRRLPTDWLNAVVREVEQHLAMVAR